MSYPISLNFDEMFKSFQKLAQENLDVIQKIVAPSLVEAIRKAAQTIQPTNDSIVKALSGLTLNYDTLLKDNLKIPNMLDLISSTTFANLPKIFDVLPKIEVVDLYKQYYNEDEIRKITSSINLESLKKEFQTDIQNFNNDFTVNDFSEEDKEFIEEYDKTPELYYDKEKLSATINERGLSKKLIKYIKHRDRIALRLQVIICIIQLFFPYILQNPSEVKINVTQNIISIDAADIKLITESLLIGLEGIKEYDHYVNCSCANIRESPNTYSRITDKIYKDTKLRIIESIPYWCYIEYKTFNYDIEETMSGWISKKLISKIK